MNFISLTLILFCKVVTNIALSLYLFLQQFIGEILLLLTIYACNIYFYTGFIRGAKFGFSGCGVPFYKSWFSTTFLKIVVEVMTSGLPHLCVNCGFG